MLYLWTLVIEAPQEVRGDDYYDVEAESAIGLVRQPRVRALRMQTPPECLHESTTATDFPFIESWIEQRWCTCGKPLPPRMTATQ